jgi:hypothetical protein
VIGFANRQPDVAAAFAEGCGYLLLGVEPGTLPGVTTLDIADIESGVVRYLGADGPRYLPTFVDIGGQHVLVVTTEPPKWGDPIHMLRREFEKYRDGDVFVRKHGKTERVGAEDHRLLQERLVRSESRVKLGVEWREQPEPLPTIDYWPAAVDEWVKATRTQYASAYEHVQDPTRRARWAERRNLLDRPEQRTKDEYFREVDAYLEEAKQKLPAFLHHRAVEKGLPPIRLKVVNRTEQNFTKVKVDATLPPAATAYEKADVESVEFPKPPRIYGTPVTVTDFSGYRLNPARIPNIPARALNIWAPEIENTNERTRIRFSVGDLRPQHDAELEDIYLVVAPSQAGKPLRIEWTATATNADGTASDSIEIPIADEIVPPVTVLE